ncbi:hypothetical protein A9Z40_03080 [Microbacterium arborescens]|uniref:Uncharacterized protein n=1 Tax=Microbacterium arborescens TaxID=33883 RepID=A0ABX2WIS9_9MICO|nr:hypothetical protein [Microbacterium arborescens]OAZ40939.1 hypothetical protein A9Z40_03080 [Microbacterium arborescens]
MTSEIPVLSERWRSTPDEFAAVLGEAQALAPQPTIAGKVVSPSWHLETSKNRIDRPEGSAEKIAPGALIPSKYAYASVLFGESTGKQILVRLARWGVRIEIHGSDADWLKQTELWARDAARKYRPRWWRLASIPGLLVGIVLCIGLPFLGSALAREFGIDGSVPTLIGVALGFGYVATCVLLSLQPRVIVSDGGRTRAATFGIQAALMVISGVVGWVLGRIGDAVVPPPGG